MQQITVRVEETTKESLEGEADERDENLSQYIRHVLRARNDDDVDATDDDRVQELRRRIDDLRDDREEMIRLEARTEQLEAEVERLREERDRYQSRYHESQGKLKVRNSSEDEDTASRGWLARLLGR